MLLLYILISLVTFPLYIIVLITFKIYHDIVFLILKIRYGEKLNHVEGIDAFWTIGKICHNVINAIFIVNGKDGKYDVAEDVREVIQKKILDYPDKYVKLVSSLNYFLGYSYLLKKHRKAQDMTRVLDVEGTSFKTIEDVVSSYCNKPMPFNDELLWEVIVIKAPNDWKRKNNIRDDQHILFHRVSHAIGDGLSFLNMIALTLGENNINIDKTLQHLRMVPGWTKIPIVAFLIKACLLFIAPGYILVDHFRRIMKDRNWPTVSTYHNIAFRVEKQGENIMETIKKIKKAVPGSSFTGILLAAYSTSLYTFLKKHYHNVPKYLHHSVICVKDLEPLTVNGVPNLLNQISWIGMNLPMEVRSGSFLDRLEELRRNALTLMSSLDTLIQMKLYTLQTFTPLPVVNLIEPVDVWGSYSNLPVFPKMVIYNGYEVENFFFFTPHRNLLCVGLTTFTYNNKMHLGLSADISSIASKEECYEIIDNTFTNVQMMKAEIYAKNVNNNE